MRVAFAADHAGAALKAELLRRIAALRPASTSSIDLGGDGSDPNDDYPDFAQRLGEAVRDGAGRSRDPDLRLRRRRERRGQQDARRPRRGLPRHLLRPPGRGARRHERADARARGSSGPSRPSSARWPSSARRSAASRATSAGSTRCSRSRRRGRSTKARSRGRATSGHVERPPIMRSSLAGRPTTARARRRSVQRRHGRERWANAPVRPRHHALVDRPRVRAAIADRLGWLDAPAHSCSRPRRSRASATRRRRGLHDRRRQGMGGIAASRPTSSIARSARRGLPRPPHPRLDRPGGRRGDRRRPRPARDAVDRRQQVGHDDRAARLHGRRLGARPRPPSTSAAPTSYPGEFFAAITDPGKSLEAIPHHD